MIPNEKYLIYNKAGGYTGWIGNLMMQIAATIGIARKNGLQPRFVESGYFDKEFYSFFKGPFPLLSKHELAKIQTEELAEPHFHYHDFHLDSTKNYNLTGYFQSEKYWKHCEDEIRKVFEFRNAVMGTAIGSFEKKFHGQVSIADCSKEFISIHVRRGDYTTQPQYHPVMTMDYYTLAADMLATPKSVFLVFSDDMQWCRENFNHQIFKDRIYFVEGNSPAQDMYLQSLCMKNIICNSTFSWWAAYLNKNVDKKIIAPRAENWFGPERKDWVVNDVYCDNWILV